MTVRTSARSSERGQSIVLLTVSLAVVLLMSAVVLDGGNVMAQQRAAQNAADSASLAGTTVLLQLASGDTSKNDSSVAAAVAQAFADNGTAMEAAYYVDVDGNDLAPVGGGFIPVSAQGVRVVGSRTFATFLAGLAGMQDMSAGGGATSVTGPAVGGVGIIPVTISVPVSSCDGSSKTVFEIGKDWPLLSLDDARADTAREFVSTVPICKDGPGGVGFLDLCPTSKVKLEDQIAGGCGPIVLDIPTWLQSDPGGPSNKKVEDALNAYRGDVIFLPLYDDVCRDIPATGKPEDCDRKNLSGKFHYHIPKFAAFLLLDAYTQGTNKEACNSPPGDPIHGNGSSKCLKGWFVKFITVGPVADCSDPHIAICRDEAAPRAVQLIR